jgi:hypothetical protein
MVNDSFRPCTESGGNSDDLIALAQMRMPYGTHLGCFILIKRNNSWSENTEMVGRRALHFMCGSRISTAV